MLSGFSSTAFANQTKNDLPFSSFSVHRREKFPCTRASVCACMHMYVSVYVYSSVMRTFLRAIFPVCVWWVGDDYGVGVAL